MSKKSDNSPWQTLEEEVYHAYREWPIWLLLRSRELEAHLAGGRPPTRPASPASAGSGTPTEKGN